MVPSQPLVEIWLQVRSARLSCHHLGSPGGDVATLFLNGKFLCQPLTGVQRFALEVVRALDDLAADGENRSGPDFVLLVPDLPGLQVPVFKRIRVVRTKGVLSTFFWEQFILPVVTWRKPLLNLAGTAPLFKLQQICTFHDAAVFDVPNAYSNLFIVWYRTLFFIQSRVSRSIITVSNFSKSRLMANLHIKPERLDVVPNAVDHFMRDEELPDERERDRLRDAIGAKPYFLVVGSRNPSKNLGRLLAGFRASGLQDRFSLVVVGGGNSKVFSRIEPADDVGIIRLGRVSDPALKDLYRGAEAFLFPSIYEGFGIPLLEAMACGCPVVASFAASIPEVCGAAAEFFDPMDIDGIATSLARVVAAPELRDHLRVQGLARVRQFSWASSAKKVLDILKDRELA